MAAPPGQRPTQGYVDPNFPNPGHPNDAPVIIYGYTPSFVLGVLAIAVFFVTGLGHTFQTFKYRTWFFSTMIIGVAFEIVGYAFRILSAKKDPYRVNFFVVQYFFIVVAPVFFAAAIYTVLSLLINVVGRQYTPLLRPKAILWTFITCDVVATIVQILGAALIGVSQTKRKDPSTANHILLGGLAFQAASFLLFIVLFTIFLAKAKRALFKVVSKWFILSFIVAVVLFYLRVCFRLAETSQGIYGELQGNEVYFGTLEFMPVAVATILLALWHPGRCVPRTGLVQPVNSYPQHTDF